ncbi:chromodomain-helicase-dna-binding protein 8 [Limosa lapponica baueri]|uniref:Chromodomain-helicase-dna-binding protein 8 n=1 Tax=Limosa lapponica baueri TaxID=1758121 RepID=A0A2I0T2B9_LIMLA|nr:chromodomain-helicase-dna-binding protein 8 [Limosa lapponica baueri]
MGHHRPTGEGQEDPPEAQEVQDQDDPDASLFSREPFNPDYVEVDRILDESHSVDKDNGEPVVYYLVKWCSLPYEDSTWELKEDVDEGKIGEFKRIQARHPELKRLVGPRIFSRPALSPSSGFFSASSPWSSPQPRPQAGSWKKLELSHEYKNHNQLREYQLEGVNWLLFNWYNRQNCILADEMGLGKTIQSIAFLQEVYNVGADDPTVRDVLQRLTGKKNPTA